MPLPALREKAWLSRSGTRLAVRRAGFSFLLNHSLVCDLGLHPSPSLFCLVRLKALESRDCLHLSVYGAWHTGALVSGEDLRPSWNIN